MVVMSIPTLQGLKQRKIKNPAPKSIVRDEKKNKRFCKLRRASNLRSHAHFILGGGLFGLLPNSVLEGVGDSLHSAADRYTYTVSVPNMYHIVGRDEVDALQAESW